MATGLGTWPTSIAAWNRRACAIAGRNLTHAEVPLRRRACLSAGLWGAPDATGAGSSSMSGKWQATSRAPRRRQRRHLHSADVGPPRATRPRTDSRSGPAPPCRSPLASTWVSVIGARAIRAALAGSRRRNRVHQRACVRIGSAAEVTQRGRPALDDLAGVDDREPVAHPPHHLEVVGDEQVGEAAFALVLEQQVEDLRLHRDVERRGRLVADDQLGLAARAPARSRSRWRCPPEYWPG